MHLLVVSDLAVGCIDAYPVGSKTSERVMMALTHSIDHDRPREFYTDAAPKLIVAMQGYLGDPYPHRTSTPGAPQTNDIAEAHVK